MVLAEAAVPITTTTHSQELLKSGSGTGESVTQSLSRQVSQSVSHSVVGGQR